MPFVSKPFHASRVSRCKRLTGALAVVVLCALTVACSDDDHAAGPDTISSTGHSADSGGNPSSTAPADPSANPVPAALTIQTPATPASDAGTALSAASPPLARPVIHTVD
ncbi:hypothetical protein [Paraburkholderia sp.]|uniref:hypothetical protein n=1 Tax=Paraburkholderia sp. TaxID=1926495 RepID=UPI0039E431F5